MIRSVLLLILIFCFQSSYAQFEAGVFAGLSDYNGDLLDKPYRFSNAAFGLTAGYQLSDHVTLRTGITFGKIAGADSVSNRKALPKRNLSFQSAIAELSITGEYYLLSSDQTNWSPFAFAGISVFHFNPYTFDVNNQKYYLKPLSTEGQGLKEYPESKPYKLTQLAFPFGGGVNFQINERIDLGAQIGLRITLSDYLDDVSTKYISEADLLAARGPKAVELSYRTDEIPGGNPRYPNKGTYRGMSGKLIYNDFYYFSGLHIKYKLGNGSSPSSFRPQRGKQKYGCIGVQ